MSDLRAFRSLPVAILLLLGAVLPASAQTIQVGSVTDARFSTAWTLDGTEMANTRAKLLNTANFGAGGTVPRPIAIADTAGAVGSVNAALLAPFNVFFIGYLQDASANAFTAAELSAFQAWVNAGGTMIVTCDDSNYDAVCAFFGHPATSGSPAINPIVPTAAGIAHPIFTAPFGAVTSINEVGTQGAFAVSVPATVLAQDSSATPLPTVLIQSFGAGRIVFLSDVDLIANGASAGSAITTQNDRFLGNLFAFTGGFAPVGPAAAPVVPTLDERALLALMLAVAAAAAFALRRKARG